MLVGCSGLVAGTVVLGGMTRFTGSGQEGEEEEEGEDEQ